MKGAQVMTIQDVAQKTGISVYTIRFYEQRGLLPPIPRSTGGIRQFREADVTFLQFLLELKRTGMSLEEMAAFTADGCLLEQLQQGIVPQEPVARRLTLRQS